MNDINNVLSVLDAINKENTFSFYVPSLKRDVKFKSITTGQQKTLLKAAVDNPIFQTRFILAAYSIINENCVERDILSSITTVDSLSILLQYRIKVYGPIYNFELDGVDYKIDLTPFTDKVRTIVVPEHQTFTVDSFTVKVGAPTLFEQFLLEKQIREKNTQDSTLNESIGEAFIGEVSKFIKEISININGNEQDIKYKDMSFSKRYVVLEKLPATVVRGLVGYLESVAEVQRSVTRFTGIDPEGNARELDITVDASLFAIN